MINNLLIIALCFMAMFQPTKQRFLVALAFSLSCAVHSIVSENLSDVLYYLSAGIADVVIVFVICLFARPDRFTDQMIIVCVFSLLLNLYGLIIYENYFSATSYNAAFYALYVAAMSVFLKKDKGNGNKRARWLRLPYRLCDNFCHPLYKKA